MFHVGRLRARLPEIVVVRVLQNVVPVRIFILKVKLIGVGERTHAQVEIVLILGAEIEARGVHRSFRLARTRHEAAVEPEVGGQVEGAVMISVVAVAHVAHGGLRRDRLQRRMRVHQAEGGEKSGIRNAPDTGLSVIIRHILNEPIDGVPGIGALVGIFPAVEVHLVGRDVDECSLGQIAAAHILIHHDEALFFGRFRRPDHGPVIIDPIRSDRVRRAHHQQRVGVRSVLGRIDAGVESDPVAHGNTVIVFRVVRAGILQLLFDLFPAGRLRRQGQYQR